MKKIRLRYAPSPTGYLHIGGARTAIFNYLFAKHYNGIFIVRIEDTDLERNVSGGIASQLDNLRWLNIVIDETIDTLGNFGPYQQTERLQIYIKYANELVTNNLAYYCYCSAEQLSQVKQKQIDQGIAPSYDGKCWSLSISDIKAKEVLGIKPSIRIRIPENKSYILNDLVRKEVIFASKDISDFVIIKSNGVATYNFAVVIDDYLMKISHVLRGEEHLSNTPKQLVVYEAFNWTPPIFGHLPLIVNENRKKLSKRDGTIVQFISQYRELGYLPAALFNFFVLLGWSPPDTQEIYSISQLIAIFDENRFSKSSSLFDVNKLNWINNKYIQKLDAIAYWELCLPFLCKVYEIKAYPLVWWQEVVALYQQELIYGQQISGLVAMFIEDDIVATEVIEYLKTNDVLLVINNFKQLIQNLKHWDDDSINGIITTIKKEQNLKGKDLLMPIRIASSKRMVGPQLVKTIKLLGQKKVMNNINEILEIFNKVG
ncbi:glutamate--tRNA ligase [Spiroplasma endosymbiont of Nephrotoma flavescens]|uniref:glutamate--tRNA ligase n=1 Tax=Spiroplasma endosymbiont of Nephrotoma flavescens TaxID=3066302 RepID=UPI00313C4616